MIADVLQVDAEQALAFRVAGHNLHERTDPLAVIAACGLQEYPPGWSAVALHARADGEPDSEDLVTVNAMRGAPYVVPRADVAVFTLALVPEDAGLKAFVGALPAGEVTDAGFTVRDALDRVSDAAREGLADGPLGRDAFHQAMRERLPDGLLPWCRGCQSQHVRPGLWRALGPLGVTEMPDKATYALTHPASMPIEDARAELGRRFLRCYGPATHSQLASWAQTAPSHAKALLEAIQDELEPVKVDKSRRFVLAKDVPRLEDPPPASGVRLLGGHDPYVAQPDRDALTPDKDVRRRLFPPVGRPGIVLRDGAFAGLWRSRKKGDVLEVDVEWLGAAAELEDEAEAVARLRGCGSVRLAAA
jgi:hypothetical protein